MKKIKIRLQKVIKKVMLIIILLVSFLSYILSLNKSEAMYSELVSNNNIAKVNPIGTIIGLKMYTNGVLVVGMSEVGGIDGKTYMPYKDSKIKEGDMIKSIDGINVNTAKEVSDIINNSKGNSLSIKYNRGDEEDYTTIKPIEIIKDKYMIGLWIRDAAAGLGTLTYYEQATNSFAALGHGINDVDTDTLLNISNGELVTAKIISIIKGQRGKAGEIRGTINNNQEIGIIENNTNIGVYGKAIDINYINSVKKEEVKVASIKEIKEGKAKIYCQLDNDGTKEYEIEIKKIYRNNLTDNKSMLIKITDQKLLDKTGGIIPGMSGTPIIQDGKFIGAITNVLLNDPTQGYAIFAETMRKY